MKNKENQPRNGNGVEQCSKHLPGTVVGEGFKALVVVVDMSKVATSNQNTCYHGNVLLAYMNKQD